MYEQVLLSHQQGQPTNELVKMFMLLTDQYASKGNWFGYSYIEDMKAEALLTLCMNWEKFNHEKYDKPFQYFTSIIHNAFLICIRIEKKQAYLKDEAAIRSGLTPSVNYKDNFWFKYYNEHDDKESVEAESSVDTLRKESDC